MEKKIEAFCMTQLSCKSHDIIKSTMSNRTLGLLHANWLASFPSHTSVAWVSTGAEAVFACEWIQDFWNAPSTTTVSAWTHHGTGAVWPFSAGLAEKTVDIGSAATSLRSWTGRNGWRLSHTRAVWKSLCTMDENSDPDDHSWCSGHGRRCQSGWNASILLPILLKIKNP